MQSRSWLFSATIFVALGSSSWAQSAFALDYQVASPIVHDNMAVYPIKSRATPDRQVLLTLDKAIHGGLAKIHETTDHRVTVDNDSGLAIFVPFGTLLTGGLQDQVVGNGVLVPPNAQGVPIYTYCVDPFRSTARPQESADSFQTSGTIIPRQTAKLSMLLSLVSSRAVNRIRQSGVWWSIDTLRTQLEKELGTELEPPKSVPWTRDFSSDNRATLALASRASPWSTSLPMALNNLRLGQSLAPYLQAFDNPAFAAAGVAGAVFVINGQVAGAETYRSPRLFQQMLPHLLRAYATEAIAEKGLPSVPKPSTAAIGSFLSGATPAGASDWDWKMGATYVSDGHNVLYSENRDADNLRIQATYLPKALPKGMGLTPDALAVDVLEQEKVNGISIGSLSDSDVVTFRRNPGDGAFVTVLASTPSATSQSLPHPDGNAVILDGNLSSSSSATSQSLPHPDGNAVMLDGNLERMFIAIIATWLGVATLMLCLGAVGLGLVSLGRHLSRSYKAMVRWGARLCGGVRETLAWLRRCGSRAQKIMERPLIPNPLALLRGSIGYVLQSARRGLRRRRNRARGTGLVAAPASTISRSSKIEILPIAKAAPSPSEIATRESR